MMGTVAVQYNERSRRNNIPRKVAMHIKEITRNVPSHSPGRTAKHTKKEPLKTHLTSFQRKNQIIEANANVEIAVKSAWLPLVTREVTAGERKRNPIIISGVAISKVCFASR